MVYMYICIHLINKLNMYFGEPAIVHIWSEILLQNIMHLQLH